MSSRGSQQTKEKGSFLKLLTYMPLVAFWVGVSISGVSGEPFYEINGYYLGATPAELGVKDDSDSTLEKKNYDSSGNSVRLFLSATKTG